MGKMKLIMIGPMPLDGEALGGAKTAFLQTVRCLSNSGDFHIDIISVSRQISSSNGLVRVLKNMKTLVMSLLPFTTLLSRTDLVVINMSSGGVFRASWVYAFIAKLFAKKIVLRVFGGNLYEGFSDLGRFRKMIVTMYLSEVALLVLETKYLCRQFDFVKNVYWLPNCRNVPESNKSRLRIRNISFLSHIRKDKGIVELLEASVILPPHVQIKVYGALDFDVDPDIFCDFKNVEYIGSVGSDVIPSILNQTDLVVLPTYYEGEGYPGTIIEAFQSGVPVVATKWKSIPEVVQDGLSGILVEPKNHYQLALAIMRLIEDEDLYREMSKQALIRGEFYRCNKVYEKFSDRLHEIIECEH